MSKQSFTFKSLGEIVDPLTKDIGIQYADNLERQARELETEAQYKRFLASRIREGAQKRHLDQVANKLANEVEGFRRDLAKSYLAIEEITDERH